MQTAEQAMSGDGGLHASARWHTRGRRIIYTATSTPLATLEIAANLRTPKFLPTYRVVEIEVPDTLIISFAADQLPAGWDEAKDEPTVSRLIGDSWMREQLSVALRIPSVIIPDHYNVLLNPEHPDFDQISCSDPVEFPFDARIKS